MEEKKMELNLLERFTVLKVLPKEGSLVTLRIVRELQNKMAPSEEEIKKCEIKQEDNGNITWNPVEGSKAVDIVIGDKQKELIRKELEKLDKENKLTMSELALCDKFMEG